MHHAIKSATLWVCLKGGYLYSESSKSTGSSFFRPMKWPELVGTPSFRQTYTVMGIRPSYYQETSYWRHGPSKSIPCFRLPGWICIYEGPLHCPPRHHQHHHHHHHHWFVFNSRTYQNYYWHQHVQQHLTQWYQCHCQAGSGPWLSCRHAFVLQCHFGGRRSPWPPWWYVFVWRRGSPEKSYGLYCVSSNPGILNKTEMFFIDHYFGMFLPTYYCSNLFSKVFYTALHKVPQFFIANWLRWFPSQSCQSCARVVPNSWLTCFITSFITLNYGLWMIMVITTIMLYNVIY